MMSTHDAPSLSSTSGARPAPASFDAWRAGQRHHARLPVIAVAGTRGKSTVVRMVDHIFRSAGLKTCIWTDDGVETNGLFADGELAPWAGAMRDLASGTLDVAIQELDWQTVRAVGLPQGAFPILAVTNLCGNSDACLAHWDARVALDAYPSVLSSLAPGGYLVVNAEDYAVAGPAEARYPDAFFVGQSREAPLLKRHLEAGYRGAWVEGERLIVGSTEGSRTPLCRVDALDFALQGAAAFEVMNALLASAIAISAGISTAQVSTALSSFGDAGRLLPGSFNLFRLHDRLAVVERPLPSWFLRPVLRALTTRRRGRMIALLAGVADGSDDDLIEVGRLIGRTSDALVVAGDGMRADQWERVKQGVALNDLVPVMFKAPDQEDAIRRAMKMARPEDTMLFISHRPGPILDMLQADETGEDEALTRALIA